MILDGTKQLLDGVENINVATLSDIETFDSHIAYHKYDLYLLDINLGEKSGLHLAEIVRSQQPEAKIVLYTGDNIKDYYSFIVDGKIDNIISKTASQDQFRRTIIATLHDEVLLPQAFIHYVNQQIYNPPEKQRMRFSTREKKILKMLQQGYTNQAIAIELGLKQRTIENNLTQIYSVLNVGSRTEAVLKAQELDLY